MKNEIVFDIDEYISVKLKIPENVNVNTFLGINNILNKIVSIVGKLDNNSSNDENIEQHKKRAKYNIRPFNRWSKDEVLTLKKNIKLTPKNLIKSGLLPNKTMTQISRKKYKLQHNR